MVSGGPTDNFWLFIKYYGSKSGMFGGMSNLFDIFGLEWLIARDLDRAI